MHEPIKQFKKCNSVFDRVSNARICFDDGTNVFMNQGRFKEGLIFRNGLVSVEFGNLPSDTIGLTFLNKRPFRIVLNSRIAPGRLEVSLVHEMLHVYTNVYKINLPHEQLHTLSVFMLTDIMPALKKYKEHNNINNR
jgi:hypothetical protein